MWTTRELTALIEREDKGYFSLCPELNIASRGDTVEEARKNLADAVSLFLESADSSEIARKRPKGRSQIGVENMETG